MNIAMADQIQAATADADRRIRNAAQIAGWTISDTAGPVVLAILRRWVSGSLHPCPHLRGPAPAVGLASRPGQVLCGPCGIAAARSLRGTIEDHICDGCRTWRPGDVSPGASVLGPITISHGLCSACLADDEDGLR